MCTRVAVLISVLRLLVTRVPAREQKWSVRAAANKIIQCARPVESTVVYKFSRFTVSDRSDSYTLIPRVVTRDRNLPPIFVWGFLRRCKRMRPKFSFRQNQSFFPAIETQAGHRRLRRGGINNS